jgi:hypothetical protein
MTRNLRNVYTFIYPRVVLCYAYSIFRPPVDYDDNNNNNYNYNNRIGTPGAITTRVTLARSSVGLAPRTQKRSLKGYSIGHKSLQIDYKFSNNKVEKYLTFWFQDAELAGLSHDLNL